MKKLQFVTCVLIVLATNNILFAARNWFDAGIYAAVALGSGALARQSYCYQQVDKGLFTTNMLNPQNMYGFATICSISLLLTANSLRTKQENKKLTICRPH